jgi:hypothetical protein
MGLHLSITRGHHGLPLPVERKVPHSQIIALLYPVFGVLSFRENARLQEGSRGDTTMIDGGGSIPHLPRLTETTGAAGISVNLSAADASALAGGAAFAPNGGASPAAISSQFFIPVSQAPSVAQRGRVQPETLLPGELTFKGPAFQETRMLP